MAALIVLPDGPLAAQAIGAATEARAVPASASGGAAAAAAAPGAMNAAPLSVAPMSFPLSAPASLTGAPAAAILPGAAAAAPALARPSAAPLTAPAASPAAAVSPAALPAAAAAAAPALSSAKSARSAADGPRREAAAPAGASEDAKLGALFDGEKKSDPDSTRVFLVRPGEAPLSGTLAELSAVLKADPDAARALNKKGAVRLVLGNAGGAALAASPEFKAKYPAALGVAEVSPVKQAWQGVTGNPLVKVAFFPFRWLYRKIKGVPEDPTPSAPKAPLGERLRTLPVRTWREAAFLARTFRDSMTRPLTSEVLGGIATKSFPLATSIGVYWTTVGMSHPFAMGGLMALSLFQEIFHGIFLNTWNNFQEGLSRMRGFSYQMYFNLAYMQGFGALYRSLSWSANPHKTIPPWSPFYWKDVLVMSLVGTFFGTLGYNGLNTLYAKGRLKRWQRSGIQQLRDVLFLLAGPFFATGSMHAFWALFIFQQALDLTIALIAWRAKTRAILYVAAAGDVNGADAAKLTEAVRAAGVTAPAVAEKLTIEAAKGAAK